MNLKSKYGSWALITGASSGIGEEFARRLASQKINLVLVARGKNRLDKLSLELKKLHNIETLVVELDLTSENFINNLISATDHLEIDILINNAGIGSTGEFKDCDPLTEANLVKLNCFAPTIISHHYIPKMIEKKKGAIIFLGSLVAFQPTPFMATYAASKSFNAFLGNALWWELKKFNIDVLTLNPGGTETEFQRIANVDSGLLPRSVQDVVSTALKSLGKKPNVVDGFLNKLMAVSGKYLSRKLLVNITGVVTKFLYLTKSKNPS